MAIARELGLPEDQIHGIQLAAIVHDLGKIKAPAEILAKPGKLTDIEFSLIKTHPQAGYEILKDVEFPWPIADIIRQHHEKLGFECKSRDRTPDPIRLRELQPCKLFQYARL